MAKQTYTKDERKAQFLKAGVALAKKDSLEKVSVAAVAAKCNVTAPLVFHVFGNRALLQAAIKREAKKLNLKLPEPKAVPARKRSVAEVKAIKSKLAAPKVVAKKSAGKAAAKTTTGSPRKVVRSAKSGKFVDKAAAKRSPATTVTQKFQTQPAPAVIPPSEPKATL